MPESHRRILQYGTIALALLVVFTIPDVIFDLSLGFLGFVFDHLFELGHILFEMIESILDKAVEHIFHTDLHQTQTIVFYVMLVGGIYIGYLIFRAVVPFCRHLLQIWGRWKSDRLCQWQVLSLGEKIKWICAASAGLYLLSFLFF